MLRDKEFRLEAMEFLNCGADFKEISDKVKVLRDSAESSIDKIQFLKPGDNADALFDSILHAVNEILGLVFDNIAYDSSYIAQDLSTFLFLTSQLKKRYPDAENHGWFTFDCKRVLESFLRNTTQYILNFCEVFEEVKEEMGKAPEFLEGAKQ